MDFTFEALSIPDVVLVRPGRHVDPRGTFQEMYRLEAFREAGLDTPFVQTNLATSSRGVLRGLHYQVPPHAQGKLVAAVRGAVFDVAVDLRREADTFGQWVGHTLSEESGELLWVPPGFAHGYCVLSERADVLYQVTSTYVPDANRGLRWDDPAVAIAWPLSTPVLSEADQKQPDLMSCDNPF